VRRTFCDGIPRRDFIRVGSFGLFGYGASLPGVLEAKAAAASAKTDGKQGGAAIDDDISVIYIFLAGGLSTIDTFDMKPDAPAEIRGEFKPISTNVAGIQVADQIPTIARHADKFSLIRSFYHNNSGHGAADEYMLTGYLGKKHPSFGSVVAQEYGGGSNVPPYVVYPRMHSAAGPTFLGSSAAPFLIEADPSAPDFSVPDLSPPLDIDASRLGDRAGLLKDVDRFQHVVDAGSRAGAYNRFREKAFGLMTSPEAKEAFNIQAESEKTRAAYGNHTLGQCCLLARRLVESGTRYVWLTHNNWDTHEANFLDLRESLLPQLDQGYGTLLQDLSDRGMLEKTLVVLTGEFGRTPKVNNNAGRDHWGPVFTLILAGGGIQGGRVVGSSDEWAAKPKDNPVHPYDFARTLYHLLGIDSEKLLYTLEKRPVKLLDEGRLIHELL